MEVCLRVCVCVFLRMKCDFRQGEVVLFRLNRILFLFEINGNYFFNCSNYVNDL